MPEPNDSKPVAGFWQRLPEDKDHAIDVLYLVMVGFFVGLCASAMVAAFRVCATQTYDFVIKWVTAAHPVFVLIWFIAVLIAAYITGRLIRNPAIRFGGSEWIRLALENGQVQPWHRILAPKFIGSYLVKSCGVSVGMEGPSIQLGAATALGLKNFDNNQKIERRYFIEGGCAAGLATAFSAPFAGICWFYEILKGNLTAQLFVFMLAGSFGVYASCTWLFGFGTMLPLGAAPMPGFASLWIVAALGLIAGLVGGAYNYLLLFFIRAYAACKWLPVSIRPFFPFTATALILLVFPAVTGEGFTIFTTIEIGRTATAWLCLFVLAKLVYTAFCFGSSIPAGRMVPVLCLGGVTGAVFANLAFAAGLLGPEYGGSLIAIGMAGAFAASERAPVTALVLVAQTTGCYETCPGLLLAAAIGAMIGRLLKVKDI